MAKRIVKQGETGLQIAEELGISYNSLLSANPGVSSIKPGVTLRIPTAAPTADPKSPWTPDLPQPDPKDPYVPPPVQPPYLPPVQQPPRPPVSAGSLAPPPVQPPYLPSRVPVGRGAQRQPLPPGVGQGAGIIPGTFGGQQADIFTQSVFPVINDRIQAYLDRIYKRYAPAARQAFAGFPALQERVGITGPIQPSQQRTQASLMLFLRGSHRREIALARPPDPHEQSRIRTARMGQCCALLPGL